MKLEGTSSFSEVLGAKEDETIVFGWVVFESRESRDRANKLVSSDPRMVDLIDPLTNPNKMIFDPKRMLYGGFKLLI